MHMVKLSVQSGATVLAAPASMVDLTASAWDVVNGLVLQRHKGAKLIALTLFPTEHHSPEARSELGNDEKELDKCTLSAIVEAGLGFHWVADVQLAPDGSRNKACGPDGNIMRNAGTDAPAKVKHVNGTSQTRKPPHTRSTFTSTDVAWMDQLREELLEELRENLREEVCGELLEQLRLEKQQLAREREQLEKWKAAEEERFQSLLSAVEDQTAKAAADKQEAAEDRKEAAKDRKESDEYNDFTIAWLRRTSLLDDDDYTGT